MADSSNLGGYAVLRDSGFRPVAQNGDYDRGTLAAGSGTLVAVCALQA